MDKYQYEIPVIHVGDREVCKLKIVERKVVNALKEQEEAKSQ